MNMFEELYALAVLYSVGFDTGDRFVSLLNEMTLDGPEEMLDLQFLPLKEAVIHTMFLAENREINVDHFGEKLMMHLREFSARESMPFLVRKLVQLWINLPRNLRNEQPFVEFCGADDYEGLLSEDDHRKSLELLFDYYELEDKAAGRRYADCCLKKGFIHGNQG